MRKWTVTHTGTDGATVTVVSANAVNQDSDFLVFTYGDRSLAACFPVTRVVSVVEAVEEPPKQAPEVPAVSRKHPVYTYGKGDLLHALSWARREALAGSNVAAYLQDIMNDLQKGS